MTHALPHARNVTAAAPSDESPTKATGRMSKVRKRLESAASGIDRNDDEDTSGWYVRTGEGGAVAAGSEDLDKVDLGHVLGEHFRLAVHSVAEVGDGAPGHERSDRINDIQRAYKKRLGRKK